MRTILFWLTVIVVIACLRGVAYLEPDPCDAYTYAYVGAKWLDGKLLYRDLWENKPPAIYLLNAGAFAISRIHHWRVLYVFECVAALLTALCLCGIVRRWLGRPHDRTVTIVAVVLAFCTRFSYSGNMTEGYQVAFAVFGLWVVTVVCWDRSAWWYLLAGLLIGIGGLFKPPGMATGMAVIIWLMTEYVARRLSGGRACIRAVMICCGLAIPWLVTTVWFASYGLAREMLYASFVYNRYYRQEVWRTRGPVWVVLSCQQELWIALPIVAGAVYAGLTLLNPVRLFQRGDGERPDWRWLALLWMLGDLGGALAGGRSYQHYFVPFVVSATVLAGFALADATRSLAGVPNLAPSRRVAVSVLGIWLTLIGGRDLLWGASLLRSGGQSAETVGRYELAKKAQELARPGDKLFTWGSAAFFFYEAWLDPIYADRDAHRALDFEAKAAQVGRDVLALLQREPPRFIVSDVNEDHPQRRQPDILNAYEYYCRILKQDYEKVLQRGPRALHVRIDRPQTTQATTSRAAG